MDRETDIKNLEILEENVEYLVELCKEHMRTNLEFKEKIQVLEEELKAKREAENHLSDRKMKMKARVGDILSKMDEYRAGANSSER